MAASMREGEASFMTDPMEAKNADLSALRINRSAEPTGASARSRWSLTVALVATGLVVVGVAVVVARRTFGAALEVRLATATMMSPSQASAVLVASGYVVAQRKAAVASKGTGRLVYL